jgi:hypothetical protein
MAKAIDQDFRNYLILIFLNSPPVVKMSLDEMSCCHLTNGQDRFLRACTIKLFTAVIVAMSLYARVFAITIHFHHSLTFAGKAGAHRSPLWGSTLMTGS